MLGTILFILFSMAFEIILILTLKNQHKPEILEGPQQLLTHHHKYSGWNNVMFWNKVYHTILNG